MAQWQRGVPPIKIVAASDLRPSTSTAQHTTSNRFLTRQSLRTDPLNSSNINPSDIPINSAFYPLHSGNFVRNYQAHAYTGTTLDHHFPPPNIAQQPTSTNTLNPTLRKYQRFKTPPSKHTTSNYQKHRISTGRLDSTQPTSSGTLDTRYVRSFSGPLKRPAPLYQKRKEPRPNSYHLAETYGTIYDRSRSAWPSTNDPYSTDYPSLFYVPQIPVYASATEQRKFGRKLRKKEEREFIEEAYPLAARLGIKIAEFIFALIILGLILSPTRGLNLSEFLRKSQTEWQGVVLAGVLCLCFVTCLLLLTICCANSRLFWRRIDIVNSALSSFLYLVMTCIETYFAACYPPYGVKIALVCYRVEWIVAAVMCFFQIVIYITDLLMALRTGVSLL